MSTLGASVSTSNAYQDYLDELADYREQQAEGALDAQTEEPTWKEWDVPTLHQTCIQANVNVVALEPAQDSTFDYWLKISTLEFRKPLLVPVNLAAYHRQALAGKTINTSATPRSEDASPSSAHAWRRKGSRSSPPPAARAGSVSPAMSDRRSIVRS